jgi:hypothetical protein
MKDWGRVNSSASRVAFLCQDRAEAPSGLLMVQCSEHVIPPAIKGQPHQPTGARSRGTGARATLRRDR